MFYNLKIHLRNSRLIKINLARLEGEISELEEQLKSIDKIANLKDKSESMVNLKLQ